MQERERSLASASTMRGKRSVRLLPGLAVKLHPLVVLAGNHPEAVVLDLVQPLGAGGRLLAGSGKARLDESLPENVGGRENMGWKQVRE